MVEVRRDFGGGYRLTKGLRGKARIIMYHYFIIIISSSSSSSIECPFVSPFHEVVMSSKTSTRRYATITPIYIYMYNVVVIRVDGHYMCVYIYIYTYIHTYIHIKVVHIDGDGDALIDFPDDEERLSRL